MTFSVLIPVYNVEAYLPQCLDSVLSQTFSDYEVILVDDGSTDDSSVICDRYRREYPEKIRVIHKDNQGQLSTRLEGVQAALGEYCVFVDSDDFIEPEMLGGLAACLAEDTEIDVLLYSFRYFRDGRKAERYPVAFPDGSTWTDKKNDLYEALAYTNKITSMVTKVIRRELLLSDPTDYTQYYGKNMAEDLLQSLYPITAARKIRYTDAVLYNYRINSESISHSYTLERIANNDTRHVYDAIRGYLPRWDMDTADKITRLDARWFNDTMYQFCKCYESAETRRERREALRFDWDSMLPADGPRDDDPYLNKTYRRLYALWQRKAFFKLRAAFVQRKIRRLKKNLKVEMKI